MSILHRSTYFLFSSLLVLGSVACGGDDDDDDDTPDASVGDPDASVDEPDASEEPDAADEADAAPVEGDQFLLGLDVTAETSLGTLEGVSRNIITIDLEGTTADLTLQAIFAPECNKEEAGQPVGDPVTATAEIAKDGSFTLELVDVTLPAGSFGNATACGLPVVVTFTINGQVQKNGAPCGDFTGTSENPLPGVTLSGTFGGVPIETGTVGDENLPKAELSCPPK